MENPYQSPRNVELPKTPATEYEAMLRKHTNNKALTRKIVAEFEHVLSSHHPSLLQNMDGFVIFVENKMIQKMEEAKQNETFDVQKQIRLAVTKLIDNITGSSRTVDGTESQAISDMHRRGMEALFNEYAQTCEPKPETRMSLNKLERNLRRKNKRIMAPENKHEFSFIELKGYGDEVRTCLIDHYDIHKCNQWGEVFIHNLINAQNITDNSIDLVYTDAVGKTQKITLSIIDYIQ